MTKPVILLVIDTLMPVPLETAIQTGQAPALQYLLENGRYIPNMVTAFPTMSVTIDSTLITGTYPDEHHIPGLNWYSVPQKRIVNYGTGFRETLKLGANRVVRNMFDRLNNDDLSREVTTIYEDLAERGFSSASINTFVYRGTTPKKLLVPRLLATMTRLEKGEWMTKTPPIFSLGAFSKLRPWGFAPQMAVGNYKFAARELRYLIRKRRLPALTICTFQDLDLRIHFKGPMDVKGISRIDREIQKTLNLYPSWEDALTRNVWLVLGDNGHAPTGANYWKFIIDLRKMLNAYQMVKLQHPVRKSDQLVLCVNQRMAYIYVLDKTIILSEIVNHLTNDARIDIIAWKDGDNINVVSGLTRGQLCFRKGGEFMDVYGQTWTIEGDREVLDLTIADSGEVSFGNYPDALARLYGALYSHPGRFIVVNAKPGCEFKAQSTPFHLSGAAHGSLHKQESVVPLIIAGAEAEPEHARLVDIKDFVFRLIVGQDRGDSCDSIR